MLFPEIFRLLSVRMAMWKQLHLSFDLCGLWSPQMKTSFWVIPHLGWFLGHLCAILRWSPVMTLPSGPFLVYHSSLEPDVVGVPRHLVLEPESLSLPVSPFPNRPAPVFLKLSSQHWGCETQQTQTEHAPATDALPF